MAKSEHEAKKGHQSPSSSFANLEQSKSAVLNSLISRSSQRTYVHAIREFIEYCSEPRLAFNKTMVTRYTSMWCKRRRG